MNNTLSITSARDQLPTLIDQIELQETYITVRGQIKAALVSAEEYLSLKETLATLADSQTMKAIAESIKDFQKGNYVSWEEAKKQWTE